MSGGLDSSVAAALLKKQGHECIGLYLNVWTDPTLFSDEEKKRFPQNKCCSLESLMIARSVCQDLGIPFYTMNVEHEFKEKVVDYFLKGFINGETPNPCVMCNKTIKFGAMFEKMKALGCNALATGHYVYTKKHLNGRISLYRGNDQTKDQSYYLYNLTQEKLQNLIFPLGKMTKKQVRALAKKFNLTKVMNKRESQGICFFPEKTPDAFLSRNLKEGEDYREGEIKNKNGEILVTHKGLPFFTIGQRKGIGIGGGPALFVTKTNPKENSIIVGSEEDLLKTEVEIHSANFLSGNPPSEKKTYDVRIRNHAHLQKAKFKQKDDKIIISFQKPVRAVMPGQSLVLYSGSELIGGGIMQ